MFSSLSFRPFSSSPEKILSRIQDPEIVAFSDIWFIRFYLARACLMNILPFPFHFKYSILFSSISVRRKKKKRYDGILIMQTGIPECGDRWNLRILWFGFKTIFFDVNFIIYFTCLVFYTTSFYLEVLPFPERVI